MRHGNATSTLGLKSQHRRALLANLVCSLIEHHRITTTVAKAKEARRHADKMITLAKKGTLHHRRQALAFLRQPAAVHKLFAELGQAHADRPGGYTRVVRVGARPGDAAELAILEWTGITAAPPETDKPKAGKEPKPGKADKSKAGQKAGPKPETAAKTEDAAAT